MTTRILGIDPGTLRVGWGILDRAGTSFRGVAWGVIRASGTMPDRLLAIFEALTVIVGEHKPTVMSLEDVFFGKDVRAMEKIGEGRAIAKLVAAQHGMSLFEYPPASVKLAVAGHGAASKESVGRMVMAMLSLKELPHPADVSDALALALCHGTRGPSVTTATPRGPRKRKGWTSGDVERLSAR